jgi:GT2 family glycosyltransferase
MISICIPSWDSLEYLKILIASIKKNTRMPHEIIVHDNGSADETLHWLIMNKIKHTKSDKNLGFCGVNAALKEAKYPYCMIVNTDMFMLPGWDLAITSQINAFKKQGHDRFTISSCLIEPTGNNPEYDIFYAGHDTQTFDEKKLLEYFSTVQPKKINTTQYSHPILIPKFMLEEVNYFDETYFPGWAVDHDLPMSLYQKGCRNFIMLGNSRVFHFSSKTFKKLPDEIRNRNGHDIFQNKWSISVDEFRKRLNVAQPYAKVPDGLF